MIRFTVPEASPSQNEFAYRHWRKGSASKKKWLAMMWAALPRDREPLLAKGKRKVTVERHGPKQLDFCNLVGGLKGIVDNLTELGLLVDDSPKWVEFEVRDIPIKRGEEPHTVFVLEDL